MKKEELSKLIEKESKLASAIDNIDSAYYIINEIRTVGEDDWHFLGMVNDVLLMCSGRVRIRLEEIKDSIEELQE